MRQYGASKQRIIAFIPIPNPIAATTHAADSNANSPALNTNSRVFALMSHLKKRL